MKTPKRKWSFMVYLAGDNGAIFKGMTSSLMAPMERAGYEDIREMQAVGSTADVAILAQFDTLAEGEASYRLHVQPAGVKQEWVEIPEQNTGDPRSLVDFVLWGMTQYPAQNYAVVLWNHGTGWKEDDIYAFARGRNVKVAAGEDEVRSATGDKGNLASSLFLSAAMQVVALEDDELRGIAYDDSSIDFLDNHELESAFAQIEARTGQRVNLIGMDACLMTMLEVAYQLRTHGEVLVGSQEVEPMAGWPYTAVLQALVNNPNMSTTELGGLIVEVYGESYDASRGGATGITQSALDLSRVTGLTEALSRVAASLRHALDKEDIYAERALFRVRPDVLRFYDRDFVDLPGLLTLLRDEYTGDDQQLAAALAEAVDLLEDEAQSPVLANVTSPDVKGAHGLSIYLPDRGCSPFYNDLAFAESGWNTFIHRLNRIQDPERGM